MKNGIYGHAMRIFCVVVLFALVGFASHGAAHRFTVTLNYTNEQGEAKAPAQDVPLLLRVSPELVPGFDYLDTASGTNFEITDEDGLVLPYEIDTWSPGGESLLWVKVPCFANGKILTVTYGRVLYDMSVDAADVWTGYAGVWHMNETNAVDSTANHFDGKAKKLVSFANSGCVGKGISIDGSTSGSGISCGEVLPNPELLTNGCSVSAWVKPSAYNPADHPHGQDGFAFFGKKGCLSVRFNSETNFVVTTPSGDDHKVSVLSLPAPGEWFHVATTFITNTTKGCKFYLNGDCSGSVNAKNKPPANPTETTELFLGRNQWNGQEWRGDLDEIRLMTHVASPEYLAAEYAAMAQDGLLQYGVLEAVSPTVGDKYHHFDVTVNYAGAAATNLPVLLRLSTAIDGFSYADFVNFGRDLEISDENGNNLPYEIDTWNTNGESLVWVKMPIFENGKTMTVTYGRSTSDGTAQSTAVWSGYSGVWHLNILNRDNVAGAPFGSYPNSPSNVGIDGKKAKRSTANEPGKFGKSVRITNNSTNDYSVSSVDKKLRLHYGGVIVDDGSDGCPIDVGTSGKMTISGWFKHTGEVPSGTVPSGAASGSSYGGSNDSPYNYDRFFFKRKKSQLYEGGFALELENKNPPVLDSFVGTSPAATEPLSALTNWTHFAFVYDGTKFYVVTNGVSVKKKDGNDAIWTVQTISDNNLPLTFGNCYLAWDDGRGGEPGDGEGERAWNGWIDEVRLSARTAFTKEYIAAEYAAMAEGVLSYGVVEEKANDVSMVAIGGVPSCGWDEDAGAMRLSAVVTGGRGKVYAEFTDLATGNAFTNEVATVAGTEDFPLQVVHEVPELEQDHMYSFAVIAVNASRTQCARTTGIGEFYNGRLSVACERNVREETMESGLFRISRADAAEAKVADLDVAFWLAGTAIELGTVNAAIVQCAVTIPAGSAFVDVEIRPVYNPSVDMDTTVTLTLSSSASQNPLASTDSLTVFNTTADLHVRYVATGGDDDNLGCTSDSPKKTIAAAVAAIAATAPADVCTIHVAPGEYQITSEIGVSWPIHIVGEGATPDDVVVTNVNTASSAMHRIFTLNNEGAMVAGLTIAGGCDRYWNNAGAGFRVDIGGGTISNCVVRDCYSMHAESIGGVGGYMQNGLVTHTVFRNLEARLNSRHANASLCLTLSGYDKDGVAGMAENCLFVDCYTTNSMVLVRLDRSYSVGAKEKAALRNCTIANCYAGGDGTNIYVSSEGEVSTNFTRICAVMMYGNCEVKNVVAAGNTDRDGNPLALVTNGGQGRYNCFENCATDCQTDGLPTGTDGVTASLPASTVVGTVSSFFKNYARGDYRPKIGGPLVNAGTNYEDMAAIDLLGKPRKVGRSADIGCYESEPRKFNITIR